jgi:hypothetical protein
MRAITLYLNKHIILKLQSYKTVTIGKTLLMKIVSMVLKVYHLNLATIFRHKDVNITIKWVAMIATADYLTYTRGFAMHIVKSYIDIPLGSPSVL